MQQILRTLRELRALRDPVFLAAFAGRGGGSAAAAVQYLVDQWDAQPVAELDGEESFDYTVRRPVVKLQDGVRIINWPTNQFFVYSQPDLPHDFILLPGIEPHLRWRAFTDAVADALAMLGCRTAVILGSRNGALPHTRPVPFRLISKDPSFARAFDVEPVQQTYEGPTGMTTVLNSRLSKNGVSVASLTAMTPFYVSSEPNPNAVIAIVRAVDRAFGTTTNIDALMEKKLEVDEAAEEAVRQSGELRSAIQSLEQQYDTARGVQPTEASVETPAELPSGDEVVAELEEFLRGLRGGGESSASN